MTLSFADNETGSDQSLHAFYACMSEYTFTHNGELKLGDTGVVLQRLQEEPAFSE